MNDRSLLVVIRHPPYGSSLARAALDVALAAAAFERNISLLFLGDGVLQLLPGQDGRAVGLKNLGAALGSLPLYGIEQVYVDAEAAGRYGLDLAAAPVRSRPLDGEALRQLLASHDHLLGF